MINKKIAFLHTSPLHIERFENLVRKYNDTIEIKHFVDEDLLHLALETGVLAKEQFVKTIQKIQAEQQIKMVICTCSTYGQLCEPFETVYRIDQPIVDTIVAKYAKIALAYTAPSTKKTSQQLILQTAARQQKTIQLIDADCTHCWPYFEEGNIAKYERSIAQHLRQISQEVEVIFLAQASMEGAKKYLVDIKPIVVSSPEFGVKTFLAGLLEKGK